MYLFKFSFTCRAEGVWATLNVAYSVSALLQRGLPPQQLVLGVPTYGRTWRLMSSQWQGLAAPAVSEGFGKGYISYSGAKAFAQSADLHVFDDEAKVPFAARGKDWVSYDNVQSIEEKVGDLIV